MDKKPGIHWLQNNNSTDRPPTRSPMGQPNGQGPQRGAGSSLNRWLFIIVGILIAVYLFAYFNSFSSNANKPQAQELTYSDYYAQIASKNIKSATFNGQTDITGEFVSQVDKKSNYHV